MSALRIPVMAVTALLATAAAVLGSLLLAYFNYRNAPAMVLAASGARKPDPAGAREIARRLGVAPGEVLYLGDTNTDMQTSARWRNKAC